MAQSAVLSKVWPSFGDQSLLNEVVTCQGPAGSLASDVLATFKIPHLGGAGGNLNGLDIKRMDALAVIQLSLLESSATAGYFIEPIVNESGQVEFVNIGLAAASIDNQYYITNTASYKEVCTGVMITGKKELVKFKDLSFKPIWGKDDNKVIYDEYNMLDNCNKTDFKHTARIVFQDPHLATDYEDGLSNFYEITTENPDDKVVGYVQYINMSDIHKIATVDLANETAIPIKISGGPSTKANLGTLVKVPQIEQGAAAAGCWASAEDTKPPTGGVKVEIPTKFRFETIRGTSVDKFIKISGVFAVGQEIDYIHVSPVSPKDSLTESSPLYKLQLLIEDKSTKTIKLREKVHYAVYMEANGKNFDPYILFGADIRIGDPATYGNDTSYYLLNPTNDSDYGVKTGCILPVAKTKGILVQELWVLADVQTPSIVIHDPTGKAKEIAENLMFNIAPLVAIDPPAPIIFCEGSSKTLKQIKRDHDPTTTQDFVNSEVELALDKMQGLGLSLSLSFLDAGKCEGVAKTLYDHMNSRGNSVIETVYTCGPNCNPKLGGTSGNGVVNAIRYSYTDQGSYTVSVTVGGYLIGNLATIDGGATQKMQESFQARGVVIEDLGNGLHFKLSLDGLGDRIGVNMAPNIIRVGDVVSCTVHNCPVEA